MYVNMKFSQLPHFILKYEGTSEKRNPKNFLVFGRKISKKYNGTNMGGISNIP